MRTLPHRDACAAACPAVRPSSSGQARCRTPRPSPPDRALGRRPVPRRDSVRARTSRGTRQRRRRNRQHIAPCDSLLQISFGLMPGSSLGNARKSIAAPTPPPCAKFRQGIRNAARAYVVNRKDRVRRAPPQQASITSWQRRSISALARCTESKSSPGVGTGGHRRGRTAT